MVAEAEDHCVTAQTKELIDFVGQNT